VNRVITMTVRCVARTGRRTCPAKVVGPTTFGYEAASRATIAALRSQGWSIEDVSQGGTIRAALCPEHRAK
jgi:hypothetical protein